MPWLAVRFALLIGLVLASSASYAGPRTLPSLRTREIVPVLPARSRTIASTVFGPLAQRGWRASWDRDTGVPARLWGGYVAAPGSVRDAAIAERAARAFLAQSIDLLAPGAQPSDFVLVANRLDGDIRTVGFSQTHGGVPVVRGALGFVFAADRLFAIGSSAWPHVSAPKQGRAILPLVRGGSIAYHAVDIRDVGAGPDAMRIYVGLDGREVARESRVMDASGSLTYNAAVRYPGSTRTDVPAPSANITVNGSSTTTSSSGAFSWTGTSAATVVPSVTGTYVRVINASGAPATASLTVQPGGTAVWDLSSDEQGDAQVSAYIYASLAKARARTINPSASAWLDGQMNVYVNETATTCNASSTGDDVHFFRGDAQCENTGRLADLVFHEFGHSLHNNSVIAGMGDFETHLSEGLADFFAANLTEDSNVGRGIYFTNEPLRDIDPVGSERVYPLDFDFDPHVSGLIIAGALWDLRKALIRELGTTAGIARAEKIFAGIMQRADDIGTTFIAALIADDDDGNLGNNTPNYCAIERAFGNHGLVTDYATTRVSPPRIDGLEMTMSVETPSGTLCPPPTVAGITVTWQPGDGVASAFDLVNEGDTWRGSFPAQPNGTLITYAVDVLFDDGSVQTFPNNPADPRYQLFTGSAVPIYCESFNEDPMWAQASNLGLEWQWGMPVVGSNGEDPPAAFTGTNVLGTDLRADGYYRPNLIVSTTTPVIDTSKYQVVHLQYWRWLTVEDAQYDQATIRANDTVVWSNVESQAGTTDHLDREWRFHDVDLTPQIVDGTVTLTWGLASDFSKELGGWTLDDVCVVGLVKNPLCGDGEVDIGEQCDDGNNENDDGCTEVCIDEITAGGGGCCDAGNAAPGNALLFGLWWIARRRRRVR